VPEILADVKLLTVFVNPDFIDAEYYCIRAYKSLEGLVPLNVPAGCTFPNGFETSFELSTDTPLHDDPEYVNDAKIDQSTKHRYHSKIGGYASSIHSHPFEIDLTGDTTSIEHPQFCIQLMSESKRSISMQWGDDTTFYIGRGTTRGYEDRWFLDCQFG
jgi:hypothetical protein